MAGIAKEIAVVYRVNGILDVSVRNMGVRPRLGNLVSERQWEYVVKMRGTVLFKGTDLYTDLYYRHQEAALVLLRYFVPIDGNVRNDLPWIDLRNLSGSKAQWFLSDYQDFMAVHSLDTITEMGDVFAVLGDGSLAPFGEGGLAIHGDHLDHYRRLNEATV